MGGQDKGLVELAGRPMIAHVLAALGPQVDQVIINANRNLDRYAAFGWPVVADEDSGFLGPLAGLAAGMKAATTPLVLTAPCDSPLLPRDLVDRLLCRAGERGCRDRGATRRRAVAAGVSRWRRELLDSLAAYLAGATARSTAGSNSTGSHRVDFADRLETFVNVNDPEERRALEARLAHDRSPGLNRRPGRLTGHPHETRKPGCGGGHDDPAQTLAEALARITAEIRPVDGFETVATRDALDRVLYEPVHSTLDVPAHTNSAMDGYALAGAELPAEGDAGSVSSARRGPAGRSTARRARASACAS
jgi:molybdenum cofactor guanylyltransferase